MRLRCSVAIATVTVLALLAAASANGAPRSLVPAGPAIVPPLSPSAWIVALDGDGRSRLVLLDSTGVEVVTLDGAGALLARWPTSPGPTDARSLADADVAVAPSGEVAVSRSAYGQIERYAADGRLLEIIRHPDLEHPAAVEYTDAGDLIVRASTDARPVSGLYRVLAGGALRPIGNVPPGGELSSHGARMWLTTSSGVLQLSGWRPTLLLGGEQRGATVDQGDFDSIGLSDAVAVHDGVWVSDGITLQRFTASGALQLSCHTDWPEGPGLLAAIGQTLYVSTGSRIYPVRLSDRASALCARARLRLTNVRVRTSTRGRLLRLRFSASHAAELRAMLMRLDRERCPTWFCGVRLMRTVRVRRGAGTVTYRVPVGHLRTGGAYALRVVARSGRLAARADAVLLRVAVGSGRRRAR